MKIPTENYHIGDWIPEIRKFKHQCVICNKIFYAKKGAKYCGVACKSRAAIDKASERSKELKPFTQMIEKNVRILEKYYPQSLGTKPIPMSNLYAEGFNPESPHINVKFINYEGEWFRVGNYAYSINREKQHVFILNLKK